MSLYYVHKFSKQPRLNSFLPRKFLAPNILLLLILLLALFVRLDFLIASNFVIDSDEAIVGLMAKHILETGVVPTFYYGQHYMGSLEPLAVAAVFAVFGVSVLALKCTVLLFSLLFVFLVYKIGQKFGEKEGLLAALLAAFPPSPLVVWSAMARGGFIEVMVLMAAALLLFMGWWKNGKNLNLALTGLVLGLGWWVNNQIVFMILPLAAFGFFRLCFFAAKKMDRGIFAAASNFVIASAIAFISFFIGGLPFWWYNIRNDFVSFAMFQAGGGSDIKAHLTGLVQLALPIILGAKRFWESADIFYGATFFAYTLSVGLICGGFFLKKQNALKNGFPLDYFLGAFILATIGIFTVSTFGSLVIAPRYLLPLYLAIFPLMARSLVSMGRAGVAFGMAVFALYGMSNYFPNRALPGQPHVFQGQRVAQDNSELIDFLQKRSFDYVRTNYWIGYRLAFESSERVRFAQFGEPFQIRISNYEAVEQAKRELAPLVLVPAQVPLVKKALEIQGIGFKEASLSGYSVLYELAPLNLGSKLENMTLTSNKNPETLNYLLDDNLETRWTTAEPQRPGQEVVIDLGGKRKLQALSIKMGKWWHDAPRKLEILGLNESGEKENILTGNSTLSRNEEFDAIWYWLRSNGEMRFYFPDNTTEQLTLVQRGAEEVFDWSMAELEVFGQPLN